MWISFRIVVPCKEGFGYQSVGCGEGWQLNTEGGWWLLSVCGLRLKG